MDISVDLMVTVQVLGLFGSLAIAIHQYLRPIAKGGLGFLITSTAVLDLLQSASGTIAMLRMLTTIYSFQWSNGTETFITRILNDMNSFAHKSSFFLAGLVALFAFLLICRNYSMSRKKCALVLAVCIAYCIAVTVTHHLNERFKVEKTLTSWIAFIEITIDAVYMAAVLVGLVCVIRTLIIRRRNTRERFDNTTQFQNFEKKHEQGFVMMLRLCFALIFVNTLFWLSHIILVIYWTFTAQTIKFQHGRSRHPLYVFYVLYWQLVPLRGFVHFIAIWTALKWELIKGLFHRKQRVQVVAGANTDVNNVTPVVEADTMMQRSLAFGSHVRRANGNVDERPASLPLDSTLIANHSTVLDIPQPPIVDRSSQRNEGRSRESTI
jgi:hypothetical protein